MAKDQIPQPPAVPELRQAVGIQRARMRNLSRAVAGMALAVIVAVTAVATELSLDLWGRHAIYSRRLAQARARLDQTNLADQRAIALDAKARSQFQRYDDLKILLLTPDLQLIRVDGVALGASGVILFSPALGRALLAITGLSQLPPGRQYELESFDQRGAAHPILRFETASESTLVALPAPAAALIRDRRLTINALLP